MWIFTTIGFFSIVRKPGTDFLTVRARVASDLDDLRRQISFTQQGRRLMGDSPTGLMPGI